MQALTERQSMVLDFIKNSIASRGYAPTFREIGRAMGIRSTNGVKDHLLALERKGYLRHDPATARGLVIAESHPGVSLTVVLTPEQSERLAACATADGEEVADFARGAIVGAIEVCEDVHREQGGGGANVGGVIR